MLLTRLFSILCTAIFVTAVAAAAPASLFDGRTLTGWEGDAQWWRVQDGCLTGGSTTGCVRATVVDAMQHDLRTIVAVDCVGDRALGPHEANLFDMRQKYADLMTNAALMAG
jgi:maleamate amidohydrolase